MLKLGIFRSEDYRPTASGWVGRLGWMLTGHRISLRLLRTAIPASAQEIAVFEAIMQDLLLNSGIYRTTFHERFRELDRLVNELLAERFPSDAALDIQDWAASDCLTSSEWAASLLPLFPNARLRASDLTLFLVEVAWDKHVVVQERDGQPLQYLSSFFLVNVTRPDQRPRMLSSLLIKRALSVIAKMKKRLVVPAEWLDADLEADSEALSLPPFTLRKLPMIHPEAALFRAQNDRFSIACHSAFEALSRPADAIRSMNIYNLLYFAPAQLAEGTRAVWASLKPGGWWIVGRTVRENPPTHNVSIFEKTATGFRLVRRYGDGSEIETLVLETVPLPS
jgi:hypothetical protein